MHGRNHVHVGLGYCIMNHSAKAHWTRFQLPQGELTRLYFILFCDYESANVRTPLTLGWHQVGTYSFVKDGLFFIFFDVSPFGTRQHYSLEDWLEGKETTIVYAFDHATANTYPIVIPHFASECAVSRHVFTVFDVTNHPPNVINGYQTVAL